VDDIDLAAPAGGARLRIAAASGGRWASLRVGDLELLGRGGAGLVGWGNYPMAPYAGRIRRGRLTWSGRTHQLPIDMPPHAIHGVTLDRPWEVLEATGVSATLRCDFDSRWPWRGFVVQRIDLTDAGLHARLEVHALDEPMPAWTGYHPWFARRLARGGPARIELACTEHFPQDEDGMPAAQPVPMTAPLPDRAWDDVFGGVTWPARVVWDGALTLDVDSDANYVVVFNHRPDAVCVEPQTAPPNAVESDRAGVVEPGTPLSMGMHLAWEHPE